MGIQRTCDQCGKEILDRNFFDIPEKWAIEGCEVFCAGDGGPGDDSCATKFDKKFRPISQEIMNHKQQEAQDEMTKAARKILLAMQLKRSQPE